MNGGEAMVISLTPRFSGVIAPLPTILTVLTVFQPSQNEGSRWLWTKAVETALGLRRFGITPLKRGVNEKRDL